MIKRYLSVRLENQSQGHLNHLKLSLYAWAWVCFLLFSTATETSAQSANTGTSPGIGLGSTTNGVGGFPSSTNANTLLETTVNAATGRSSLAANPELGQGTGPLVTATDVSELRSVGVNQFQRYVTQATGRELPFYGYNLFSTQRYNSLTNVPVPLDYVIGPGDEIDLKIWGAYDLAARLVVDRNGQITIPKLGPISVAGSRVDQLEPSLRSHLSRVFRNFELSAALGRLRSIQVYVVGEAKKPGAYTVSGLSTLISVLFESGGPATTGSMRKIQVVRQGKNLTTLDLYSFIHRGKTDQDVRLLPGDVVVIPPAGPRVAVTGALDVPAIYELDQAEQSLGEVLTYSGGLRVVTTPHKALIERINTQNNAAPRSVQERVLDAQGLAANVRDGDVVTLFPISAQFSNAVTLRGNVAAPLRYSFKEGMRLSDLIPEPQALIQSDYYTRKNLIVQYESGKNVSGDRVIQDVKNLLDEINWDYAAIERLDASQVKTILIPFDLGKAIKDRDAAHNHLLRAGDVVTVFGVKDLPVPMEKRNQFVRLGGEVKVPGVYQIKSGETLPQLVSRAGGYSTNAYPYATVFTRESTRREQQTNLERAVRKLEQDINGQTATQLQNVTDSEKGSSVQAQIAGQKILLSRLQGLRASGRIALEMLPDQIELPALVLEDGDSITVPHKPSFVAVFGAVQAETSFIFKSGQTVGEYIDKAGPSREADLDAALVIRADGSVQVNQATRHWTGWGHGKFMGMSLNPGDTVFVPEVLDRRNAFTQFIQGAKDWTTILYQFGLGSAALKTIRN